MKSTIRSLKRALTEINLIDIDDYVVSSRNIGQSFNHRLDEARFQLEVLLNDLEEKNHESKIRYMCLVCERTINKQEYIDECECGSMGMCSCECESKGISTKLKNKMITVSD